MIEQIFSVRTTNADIAERGALLKGAAGLTILAATVSIGMSVQRIGFNSWGMTHFGIISICLLVWGLAHWGYVKRGAVILVTALLIGVTFIVASASENQLTNVTPFIIPVLIGGLVLGSTGVVVFGCLAFSLLIGSALYNGVTDGSSYLAPVVLTGLAVALIWLVMRTLERALMRVRQQADVALAAQRDLTAQQAAITSKNAELTAANEQMQALLDLVRDLETPVIPLLEGVLVLPLVGHIDTRRATQLSEAVLNTVHQQRARVVIMDITGVSVVDTAIAQRLAQLAQSIQLLGAQVLLTGIRADIAQTIVAQGINLDQIRTAGRLQDGIATVLDAAAMQRWRSSSALN